MIKKKMYALCSLVGVAFVAFQLRGIQCKVVSCYDQKEACNCPRGETVCEFKLEIEELQTFTSYVVKNHDLLSRGTPGDTYFLNGTGFHPAVPNEDVPERGDCYLNSTLVYDRDFVEQGCSVPMTVDGVTYRLFIAVNGRIPGPTLIMDDGAQVKVQVVNRLTSESVTIHWHGMHQKDTPWMDGVGFISQSPIEPGASFDYLFNATPAGTHWYHSHVGAQRTDGLFGALIVREKNHFFRDVVIPKIISSPAVPTQTIYDIPEWYTLTLLDWQRESSLDLFIRIHSTLGFYDRNMIPIGQVPTNRNNLYYPRTSGPDGIEVGPVPYWSGLINGRGRFNDSFADKAPLSVFVVTRDSVNRFRLIGAQSLYAYCFSIDNHKLRVIATDGHFITPVTVDYIIVHSGERYDFLVETFNQQETMFYIRAETLETPVIIRQHTALAVLKYGNALEHDVDWRSGYSEITSTPRTCSQDGPCFALNCPFLNYPASLNKICIPLTNLTALFPLPEDQLPKFVNITNDCDDCLRFFNFGFEGESTTSAINGKNFVLPSVPYQTNCGQYDADVNSNLTNTCNKCDTRDDEDCKCIHVVRIVQNEIFAPDKEPRTVVMVFSAVGLGNRRDFAHPIHLHGHSFHVLHVGYGDYTDGVLTNNSMEVTCGDDPTCRSPSWGQGVELSDFIEAAGSGGRIRSTLIRKDTVMVPAGGYVVVAFRADNPGYWFLHCHIEVHQLEGMGVLIEEYPFTQHKKEPQGINQHGSFRWTLDNFKRFVVEGSTCGAGGTKASLLMITMGAALLLYLL